MKILGLTVVALLGVTALTLGIIDLTNYPPPLPEDTSAGVHQRLEPFPHARQEILVPSRIRVHKRHHEPFTKTLIDDIRAHGGDVKYIHLPSEEVRFVAFKAIVKEPYLETIGPLMGGEHQGIHPNYVDWHYQALRNEPTVLQGDWVDVRFEIEWDIRATGLSTLVAIGAIISFLCFVLGLGMIPICWSSSRSET